MAIKESKGKVIALSTVLPLFASAIVALRLHARFIRKHSYRIDDYLILLALGNGPYPMSIPLLRNLGSSLG